MLNGIGWVDFMICMGAWVLWVLLLMGIGALALYDIQGRTSSGLITS